MGLQIFISYAIKDSNLFQVTKLAQQVKSFPEVDQVYYCEADVTHDFVKYMDTYLRLSNIIVLLCSPDSLQSEFVQMEYRNAIAMKKPIIPLFIAPNFIPTLCQSSIGVLWDSTDFDKNINALLLVVQKLIATFQQPDDPIRPPVHDPFLNTVEKQYYFYRDLGKEALIEQDYEVAMQQFQKALPIAEEKLYDIQALKEIKGLIVQTEQSQRAFQTYTQLLDRAEQSVNQGDLKSAADLLMQAQDNVQIHHFDTSRAIQLISQIHTKQTEVEELLQKVWKDGEKAMVSLKFEEALQHFQHTQEIVNHKLFDPAQIKRIEDVIVEIKTRLQALYSYKHLIDQTTHAIQADQLESASILLQKAHIIAQQHRLETAQEPQLTNQIQIKQLDQMAKNHQSAGRWQEALIQFQQLQQKCAALGWEDWVKYAERERERLEAEARKPCDYHGAMLVKSEYEAMGELEKEIGSAIPPVSKVESDTFGFIAADHHVTALGVYAKGLTSLPDSIGNLTALKELRLSENKLTSLPDCIGNLTALKELRLSENKLTSLPDSIGNLTALKVLRLHNNQLLSLPESLFTLKSLQELYLSGNNRTSLPDSIGNLTSLTRLELEYNSLTSLPDSIGNLNALKELYLGRNKLARLPESIGNLSALQELYLSFNKVTSLPVSIGNLTTLQTLDLQSNSLTSLPDSIGQLTALIELRLYDNKLNSLPESIGQLKSLLFLYLRENKLTSLPDSIGSLTKLETLWINNNSLKSLPDSIGNLSALKELRLSKNQLNNLPDSIGLLKSLTDLDLGNNSLASLGGSTKNALKKLKQQGCSIYLPEFAQMVAQKPVEPKNALICLKEADKKIFDKVAAEEWADKGDTLFDKKNYEEAIAAYQKAVALTPSNANYWYQLGLIYYFIKNLDESIKAYRNALQISPDIGDIRNSLAWALYEKDRYNRKNLEEALAIITPTAINSKDMNILDTYACILSALGRFEDAKAQFLKSIAIREPVKKMDRLTWAEFAITLNALHDEATFQKHRQYLKKQENSP